MKAAPFTYLDPPDLAGVLDALAEHGDDAAVISGGQSLVPLMNLRLARPEVVVDPVGCPACARSRSSPRPSWSAPW